MKMLALDTSSVACTVAIRFDGELYERHEEQPREHTRILMPMIREVLEMSGAQLRDLDAIALGNGPGSFIGMRIAASVAQGLAHGSGLNIIPVSSLAAVAAEVFAVSEAAEVAVAQDAHMNEVYLGLYARGGENSPVSIINERLHEQTAIAELSKGGAAQRVAAGDGWRRYPKLLAANRAVFGAEISVYYPRAKYLLALAQSAMAVTPKDISPAYLRQKVAEKPTASKQ